MHPRTAARLAWTLWAAGLAVLAAALALAAAGRRVPTDANIVSQVVVFLCFATVEAVLASRRPDNAVGWICSAIGLTAFLGGLSGSYGAYAAAHPGRLPAAAALAWPGGTWLWFVTVALTVLYLPLLFPTGRPPSPRWRPVAWAGGLAVGRGLPGRRGQPRAAGGRPAGQSLPVPGRLGGRAGRRGRAAGPRRLRARRGRLPAGPLPPGRGDRAPAAEVVRLRRGRQRRAHGRLGAVPRPRRPHPPTWSRTSLPCWG